MRFDLSPVLNAYQRLSSRERTLVGLAAAGLVVIIVYTMIWQPIEDARVQLGRRIQVKQRELIEIQQMREEFLDLKTQYELRQTIIEKADPRFSLFPHIEATVAQVLGGREKIASMNPQNKDLGGAYREDSVELKLNAVSLQQLVNLMYQIEKGTQPLRLTRLQVKKRAREPQAFDVTATVSMLKSLDAIRQQPEKAPGAPAEAAPAPPAAPVAPGPA